MNITEIRVKLTEDPRNKLKAYCSVTLNDEFVVRDLKIIEGVKGPFIAMPSRKLSDRCGRCSTKNHLKAAFCNGCGGRLDTDRATRDERGRARLHADLAHPIHSKCRIELHRAIVHAFAEELERSKQDGYVPASFDDLDELDDLMDDDYLEYLGRRESERESKRREERTHQTGEAGDPQAADQGMAENGA